MPSYSTGFCVATTMNGRASGWVCPSTVTCASCMHSKSADWVFGEARLISSTSTRLANTGPGLNSNWLVCRLNTLTPGDVGRQQVGGGLDAGELAGQRPGERLGQHRLADAGEVLDDQVALAQHTQHAALEQRLRGVDDPGHVGDHPAGGLTGGGDRLGRLWLLKRSGFHAGLPLGWFLCHTAAGAVGVETRAASASQMAAAHSRFDLRETSVTPEAVTSATSL